MDGGRLTRFLKIPPVLTPKVSMGRDIGAPNVTAYLDNYMYPPGYLPPRLLARVPIYNETAM